MQVFKLFSALVAMFLLAFKREFCTRLTREAGGSTQLGSSIRASQEQGAEHQLLLLCFSALLTNICPGDDGKQFGL